MIYRDARHRKRTDNPSRVREEKNEHDLYKIKGTFFFSIFLFFYILSLSMKSISSPNYLVNNRNIFFSDNIFHSTSPVLKQLTIHILRVKCITVTFSL